jgi:hypothetical protein
MTARHNKRIDANTTLVGAIAASATRPAPQVRRSGEVVQLSTKLDAAPAFALVASHPGHSEPVTMKLQLAPVLRDGTAGSFQVVATVAIPAEGGRVEALLSGHDLKPEAAGADRVKLPAFCFAKAVVQPATPEGMHVGLSVTVAA